MNPRGMAMTSLLTGMLALCAVPAQSADVMNGTELLSFCKTIDATSKAACYGYLLAFVDSRTLAGTRVGRDCELPSGQEIEMLREAIVKEIDDAPALMLEPAGNTILAYLNRQYPCR